MTAPAPPTQLSKASPRSRCGRTACKAGVCGTLAKATCIFNSPSAYVKSLCCVRLSFSLVNPGQQRWVHLLSDKDQMHT